MATILPVLLLFIIVSCKQGLDPDLNARLMDLRLHLNAGNEMLDINDSEMVKRLHFIDEKIEKISIQKVTVTTPEIAMKLTELKGMKKIIENYFLYQPSLKSSLNTQLEHAKNWESMLEKQDRPSQFAEVTKLETHIYQLSDSINTYISPIKETELGYHHLETYFNNKSQQLKPGQ